MSRSKRLYLKMTGNPSNDVFLMKLDGWIEFVDGEDYSEPIHREDLYFISRAFRISEEVLEDFFDN